MSHENLEIVRELNDAFNRGDYAAALSALAPDVEWYVPPGISIGEEVFRGHDAIQRGFALWLDAWETYQFEPTEILDHGDHVVVAGTQLGRGRGSGVEVNLQTFHVFTLRNGKVIRLRNFDDRVAALDAAGLSE
ncbi:MAG: nuclear transport factor 2 family protein [Solirubrobacterales bacterium]